MYSCNFFSYPNVCCGDTQVKHLYLTGSGLEFFRTLQWLLYNSTVYSARKDVVTAQALDEVSLYRT